MNEYYEVAPADGNGLIYHLNTVGDRGTAQVAGQGTCSNDVVIPAKITLDGKTCDVTGIYTAAFIQSSITKVSGDFFIPAFPIFSVLQLRHRL